MAKRGRKEEPSQQQLAADIELVRMVSRSGSGGEADAAVAKLTPLESQIVALRRGVAPHVLLMVNCGYKMKFFGRDSRVASRRLGIFSSRGAPFETSSVPVQRTWYHAARLVQCGYHVGIVEQGETAAMRGADARSGGGVFERRLSRVLSRGTTPPDLFLASASTGAAAAVDERVDRDGESENDDGGGGGGGGGGADGGAAGSSSLAPGEDAVAGAACVVLVAVAGGSGAVSVLSCNFTSNCKFEAQLTLVEPTAASASAGGPEAAVATRSTTMSESSVAGQLRHITALAAPSEVILLQRGAGGVAAEEERRLRGVVLETLQSMLPLNFGPTDEGLEDDTTVPFTELTAAADSPSSVEAALVAHFAAYGLGDAFRQLRPSATPEATEPATAAAGSSSDGTAARGVAPFMRLPSTALATLEVARASGGSAAASLVALLCSGCTTGAGRRLLRSWILNPLTDVPAINARLDSVAFLADTRNADAAAALRRLVHFMRPHDWESILSQLAAGCAHVSAFARLLQGLSAALNAAAADAADASDDRNELGAALWRSIAATPPQSSSSSSSSQPHLICEALRDGVACPSNRAAVERLLAALPGAAAASTPLDLFVGGNNAGSSEVPAALAALHAEERAALDALAGDLAQCRVALAMPALEFKTIAAVDFLLDVPLAKQKIVPDNGEWILVSRTKTNARFHTRAIVAHRQQLCAARDRMGIVAEASWIEWQRCHFGILADQRGADDTGEGRAKGGDSAPPGATRPLKKAALSVVRGLATLDALLALAQYAASDPEAKCRPTLIPAAAAAAAEGGGTTGLLQLRGLRHPMQFAAKQRAGGYVPNDVELGPGRAWLLTGANMGGKSALMRSVGLASLMAQVGSFVCATAAPSIPIFSAILCRMGSTDRLLDAASTFMAEMEETREIVAAPDLSSSLVLIDELGRGTSSYDGVAVAQATLGFLLRSRCALMFVTHFATICEPFRPRPDDDDGSGGGGGGGALCKFMSYIVEPAAKGEVEDSVAAVPPQRAGRLRLLYTVVDGVSPSSFGVEVAAQAMMPQRVTQLAACKSAEMEVREAHRVLLALVEGRLLDGAASSVVLEGEGEGRKHAA